MKTLSLCLCRVRLLQTNTFQAVMMSDGQESFTSFLYPANGINWPSLDEPPNAIAGFNFGNGIRSLIIPHTGSKLALRHFILAPTTNGLT